MLRGPGRPWLQADRALERDVPADRRVNRPSRQSQAPRPQGRPGEADWYGTIASRGWSEMPEVLPFIHGFARSSVEWPRASSPSSRARRSPPRRCSCTRGWRCWPARARFPKAAATAPSWPARCAPAPGGVAGLQSGDDGGGAGQRLAAQCRAQWFSRSIHAHQMAVMTAGSTACVCSRAAAASLSHCFRPPVPPRSPRASKPSRRNRPRRPRHSASKAPPRRAVDPPRAALAAAVRRRRPLPLVRQRVQRHWHGARRRLFEAPRECRRRSTRRAGMSMNNSRMVRGMVAAPELIARPLQVDATGAMARRARRVVLRQRAGLLARRPRHATTTSR